MGMYHGMDLSQFQKVKSDKKSTTLRHSKGHEIKIAHSALTPKLKGMLDGLQMFADKGLVEGSDAAPEDAMPEGNDPAPGAMDDSSPAAASDTPAETPVEPPSGNMVMDNAPPPTPEQSATANMLAPPDVVVNPPTVKTKDDLDAETAKEKEDFAKGQIQHPQTLDSLYEGKNPLGKIGMVLGMLLSGAGSGLAHQSNAYMGILKDELDRNLQAQQKSADNAQNWVRLNQQNEVNKAQIGTANAQTKLLGITAAGNQMDQDVLRRAYIAAGKLPPEYQAGAVNTIQQQLEPWVDQRTSDRNSTTAQHLSILGKAAPTQKEPGDGVDQNKVNAAISESQMGFGAKGAGSAGGAVVNPERLNQQVAATRANRAAYAQVMKNFKDLDTAGAGQAGTALGEGLGAVGDIASALLTAQPKLQFGGGNLDEAITHLTQDQKKRFELFQKYRDSKIEPLIPLFQKPGENIGEEGLRKRAEAYMPTIFDIAPDMSRGDIRTSKADAVWNHYQQNEEGFDQMKMAHALTPFPKNTYKAPDYDAGSRAAGPEAKAAAAPVTSGQAAPPQVGAPPPSRP